MSSSKSKDKGTRVAVRLGRDDARLRRALRAMRRLSTNLLAEDILRFNVARGRHGAFSRRVLKETVEEFLIREDYGDWLGLVRDGLLRDGLRHPDVLHFYIRAFLGFNIPRRRVCAQHVAPFTFVSDMFFEQVRNAIAFANRTGGKTLNIAILNHLDMAFKNSCEICSAGSTLAQTARMYQYFTLFHNNNQWLRELLYKEPTKSESIYKNGSNLSIITGSVKGLNSPHPQKARIDEVELMDWEVLQQGLSMAISAPGVMAQNCFSCITADTVLHPFDPLLMLDIEKRLGKYSELRSDVKKKEYRTYRLIDLLNLYNDPERKHDAILVCYDENDKCFHFDRVKRVWKTKTAEVYSAKVRIIDNRWGLGIDETHSTLKITPDHRIMTVKGIWMEIGDLEVGEELLYPFSSVKCIFMGLEYYGIEDVYDIEMHNHHNFLADHSCVLLRNSTRKQEYGSMQRLLDKAKEDKRERAGFKIYKWCIYEVLEQCTRECKGDAEYGDCPIEHLCKGVAKKCSGFYQIEDFIDKVVTLDIDTLDTEWFNKRPSTQLYVYGKWWQPETHILPFMHSESERTVDWLRSNKEIELLGAIDFGSSPGHAFVFKIYFCDVYHFRREVEASDPEDIIRSKITYYCVYEYRSGGATMDEHAGRIKNSPYYSGDIPIFADPSAKQERTDLWETYGIYTYLADNELLAGIDKVRAQLQIVNGKAGLYYVEGYYDCTEELEDSTQEYTKYKYRRTKEGKPNNKEPLPMHDHGLDCDRYAIASGNYYFREKFTYFDEDIQGGFWGR